jgi:hypothetical protein
MEYRGSEVEVDRIHVPAVVGARRIAKLRATNVPSQPMPSHRLCTQHISIHLQILRVVSHLPQLRKGGKARFYRRRRAGRLV